MGYVARFSRTEDGGYSASYGKSSLKLSAELTQVDGVWSVVKGFGTDCTPQKKLGTLKEEWGQKAAAAYGGNEVGTPLPNEPESPADTSPAPIACPIGGGGGPPKLGPPSLPKPPKPAGPPRLGPPALKVVAPAPPPPSEEPAGEVEEEQPPQGKVCERCHQQETGWRKGPGGRMIPPCHCDFPNTEEYEPDVFDPLMYRDKDGGRVLSALGALDMVFMWMLRSKEYVTTEGKLDPLWAEVQETLFRETGYAHYRPERFAQ